MLNGSLTWEKVHIIVTSKKSVRTNPLIEFLDNKSIPGFLEEYLTKAPEKTKYAEGWDNDYNRMFGASYDTLEKLDPIDEKQLKSIFPKATATHLVDPL